MKDSRRQRTRAILGKPKKKGVDAVPGISSRAKRLVYATGTPILNKPIEAQPLLGSLDPQGFGNFFGFAKEFCNAHQESVPQHGGGHRLVWDFSGASNLGRLQEKLRSRLMVRRLKSEVLTDLPPKRRQLITLSVDDDTTRDLLDRERQIHGLDDDHLAVLELAHAAGEEEYRAAVAALEGEAVPFEQVAQLRHDVAVAKIPQVLEHLDGVFAEGTAKCVCWAHHHDVIDAVAAHYPGECVVLDGRTPMEDRQRIVDQFQSDGRIKLFVGGIKAAGVGITLTAASHAVFAELDWVPAMVQQAEDREHRIGQRACVLVQHLVLDGSLDARIAAAMIRKQDIADQALDAAVAAVQLAAPVDRAEAARNGTPKSYPAATERDRELCAQAMRILAGACDGARKLDGSGFSKIDVRIGHSLADRTRPYTDGECWLARKLARKYRRQLGENLMQALGVGAEESLNG